MKNTLSLTYSETYLPRTGSTVAHLVNLPHGWSYKITVPYAVLTGVEGALVVSTSRADGDGSVRHYTFRTYQEALDHGTAWAKRRIALAAKREAEARAASWDSNMLRAERAFGC